MVLQVLNERVNDGEREKHDGGAGRFSITALLYCNMASHCEHCVLYICA